MSVRGRAATSAMDQCLGYRSGYALRNLLGLVWGR